MLIGGSFRKSQVLVGVKLSKKDFPADGKSLGIVLAIEWCSCWSAGCCHYVLFVGFLEKFGWPALGDEGGDGWSGSVNINVLKAHITGAEDGPPKSPHFLSSLPLAKDVSWFWGGVH